MSQAQQIAIFAIVGLALAISIVTDLRTRKIKNFVTYPTILIALALRAGFEGWSTPMGPGLLSGLIGAAVGGGFFMVLARLGGMGAGDVKLAAAVGAGVGFPLIAICLIFIGLVGGIEAVVVLIYQGKLLKTLGGMGKTALQATRLMKPDAAPPERTKVPYGVAIALGTVWGVWWYLSQPPLPM